MRDYGALALQLYLSGIVGVLYVAESSFFAPDGYVHILAQSKPMTVIFQTLLMYLAAGLVPTLQVFDLDLYIALTLFGNRVAISGDTAIVGANGDNDGNPLLVALEERSFG